MAIVEAPPVAASRDPRPSRRDGTIDLLRALCVIGVVVLHSLMVGVSIESGAPIFSNASDGTWWIVPLSWVLQVMPLFFVIGGFAGLLSYRRLLARGGTAGSFVAARVHRLLRPAAVTVGVIGILLAALALAGVPSDLIVVAGYRFGQPLWFLGVFLLCQALLPALAAAHHRAPVRTLSLLAVCAVAVDAVRLGTGVDAIGLVNLAVVWLALQQLGFFLADGSIDALSRRVRASIGTAALLALVVSFATGVHSPDLISHLNPPTSALLLVGVIHTSALSLFRAQIDSVARVPLARAVTAFVTSRTMTIYLWHMPVLLTMAGLTALTALVSGEDTPVVDSAAWWGQRPLWIATALAATALLSTLLARIETAPSPAFTSARRAPVFAALIGLCAVVLLLVVGTTVGTAAAAAGGMLLALRLVRTERSRQPWPSAA